MGRKRKLLVEFIMLKGHSTSIANKPLVSGVIIETFKIANYQLYWYLLHAFNDLQNRM